MSLRRKKTETDTKEEKRQPTPVKAKENKNVWKQPSPIRARGGKQGAWREAVGPSEKGIGFKGAGRGGKTGLNSWKQALASNGPVGLPKGKSVKGGKADSAAGLKAILGVKNEPPSQPTSKKNEEPLPNQPAVADATAGLKNMLGIAQSLPKVESETKEVKDTKGPASAADALMQLMVQAPSNSTQPMQQMMMPPQQPFNFTYVKEGEAPPPPAPVTHAPMMYSPPGAVYPPPMYYPAMMAQPMMPQQAMNGEVATHMPIPINREKKETNGVGSPLIPSVTVKAKK